MLFAHRIAIAALALTAFSAQVQAKSQVLGPVTSAGTTFGNTFYSDVANFTDYYTFTLADPGTVSGSTVDTSYVLFFSKDVKLNSLTLTNAGSSTVLAQDTSPDAFTFSGLSAGTYTLAVNGSVSGALALYGSYSGSIKAVSSPAPEPADIALTVVGLAGVGYMVRRRVAR